MPVSEPEGYITVAPYSNVCIKLKLLFYIIFFNYCKWISLTINTVVGALKIN